MGVVRDEPPTIRLRTVADAIAEGRFHYVALGDRPSAAHVGSTGQVWYSGTPDQTRFDETAPSHVAWAMVARRRRPWHRNAPDRRRGILAPAELGTGAGEPVRPHRQ